MIDVQSNTIIAEFGLPAEYQEVEYIESVGGQYINTGYLPSSAPKIEIDFMPLGNTTSDNWYAIYGRRGTDSSQMSYFCLYINRSSPYYMTPNYAGYDPGTYSGITAPINVKVNVVNDKGQFYVDGNYISASSTTNTLASANYPIFLFDNNIQGSRQNRGTKMRLYSCKLWNGGELVRDFVPCYRVSDGVIGLFDKVNKVFYTNSGSGSFTKGNDVVKLPSEYQYVEYISSSGTQYIDTDIKLNHTQIIELKASINSNLGHYDKFYGGGDTNNYLFLQYETNNKVKATNYDGNHNVYSSSSIGTGTIRTFKHTNTQFFVDWASQGTMSATSFTMNTGLNIFAMGNSQSSGRELSSYKLYYLKIFNYDYSIAYRFVPCYRKADNVIGLYEKKTGTFYTNAGSGTFTKGNDVN